MRILLALATLKDLRIFAWDVDLAYLHGRINHDVYIWLPDGYQKPRKVGKLNKALYGLLEAAHAWHEDFEEKLKSLGFTPLRSNAGIFINRSTNAFMAIDTHVDDVTGICSSKGEEIRLKTSIKKFYKIKEKDTSKSFKVLGILVTRDTHLGTLKLSQPEYLETLLERFGMNDCNSVVTPVDKGSHLLNKEDNHYENIREYQALTRSLMYVAMSTRPDIAYITQFLSQFNKSPSHLDWNAGK